MAITAKFFCMFVLALLSGVALAASAVQTVDYRDGDVNLRGFLARPESADGSTPAVLVVHEWWGLNDYTRRRTRELADLGYIAFAADMFGDGKTTTDPKEAGAMAGLLRDNRDDMRRRARAALDALRKVPGVDLRHIGAMGFCFGGTVALELARAGDSLAGVVSFHGSLSTPKPASADTLHARILVLHGGADPHVPPKDVAAFMDEMNAAKAQWRMETYGGAMHAFTNPDANAPANGSLYDADAESRSMAAMRAFFQEVLLQ